MPLQCTILKYNANNENILHNILYAMIVFIFYHYSDILTSLN